MKGITSPIDIFKLGEDYMITYPDRYTPPISETKLAHVHNSDFTEVLSSFIKVDEINANLDEINRMLSLAWWMNFEIISAGKVILVPHIYDNTMYEYTLDEENNWNLSIKYKGLFNRDPYTLTDEESGRSPDFSHYSASFDEPMHVIIHHQSRGIFVVQDYIFHFIQIDDEEKRTFGAEVFSDDFTPIGFIPIKSIPITTEERNSLSWFVDDADEHGNFYFREIYADSSRVRKMHLDLNKLPK